MSEAAVVAPIMSALSKAAELVGHQGDHFITSNPLQAEFMQRFWPRRFELSLFSPKELRAWASRVAAELNQVLTKEGFNIQLQDFRKNEFGVVSILDVLLNWVVHGDRTKILVSGKDYPAVKTKHFDVFSPFTGSHPVVRLQTKEGDVVFLTVADQLVSGLDLVEKVNLIEGGMRYDGKTDFNRVVFPMVNLDQRVDISWLVGLGFSDGSIISQALQQTKFKMNEFGARVQSAVAVGVLRCVNPPERTLVIDKPFLLWVRRTGVKTPILAAYIDYPDWKNPGSLS